MNCQKCRKDTPPGFTAIQHKDLLSLSKHCEKLKAVNTQLEHDKASFIERCRTAENELAELREQLQNIYNAIREIKLP